MRILCPGIISVLKKHMKGRSSDTHTEIALNGLSQLSGEETDPILFSFPFVFIFLILMMLLWNSPETRRAMKKMAKASGTPPPPPSPRRWT